MPVTKSPSGKVATTHPRGMADVFDHPLGHLRGVIPDLLDVLGDGRLGDAGEMSHLCERSLGTRS